MMVMTKADKYKQFKFKQFSIKHSDSSMKVGVDGVLIGAWADCSENARILDVGCGCGLISIMMAQRFKYSHITGIDVHKPSIDEAKQNALISPWGERIDIYRQNFKEFCEDTRNFNSFDLIISNPPFFNSGVVSFQSDRIIARHCATDLSPTILIEYGHKLLSLNGQISIIMPYNDIGKVETEANTYNMYLSKLCLIKNSDIHPIKRAMLTFNRKKGKTSKSTLVLHMQDGQPSSEYIKLCSSFYLNF